MRTATANSFIGTHRQYAPAKDAGQKWPWFRMVPLVTTAFLSPLSTASAQSATAIQRSFQPTHYATARREEHIFLGKQEALYWAPAQQNEVVSFTYADHVIADISRLEDGWWGEETIAPSAQVIGDIANTISSFPFHSDNLPDIQVDDDGSVSINWLLENGDMFSAIFFGRGTVLCSVASDDHNRCIREKITARADDFVHIISKFNLTGVISAA
jgi:hypothetical protein